MNSSNIDTGNSICRAQSLQLLLLTAIGAGMLINGTVTYADEQKPKVTIKDIPITKTVDTSSPTFPTAALASGLHVVSEVVIQNGFATSFSLEANLQDGSALSLDGTQSFRAVGASYQSFTPTSPVDPTNQMLDWTVIFGLKPNPPNPGAGILSDISFNLVLRATYDADGSLADLELVEQIP